MISKAKATKGSVAAIDYIMKEEKQSYELYRKEVMGQNGSEILSEFSLSIKSIYWFQADALVVGCLIDFFILNGKFNPVDGVG